MKSLMSNLCSLDIDGIDWSAITTMTWITSWTNYARCALADAPTQSINSRSGNKTGVNVQNEREHKIFPTIKRDHRNGAFYDALFLFSRRGSQSRSTHHAN
jgi:hypothetical protein